MTSLGSVSVIVFKTLTVLRGNVSFYHQFQPLPIEPSTNQVNFDQSETRIRW